MRFLLLSAILLISTITNAGTRSTPVPKTTGTHVRLKQQPPQWSKVGIHEGIQVRLTLEDNGTSIGNDLRIAYPVLEVRNVDRKQRVVHVRLEKLKLEIIDAAGKAVTGFRFPVRARIYYPTRGSIPSGCYLGMPAALGARSRGSKGAVLAAWGKEWKLDPGAYTLKGALEASVRHEQQQRETPWKKVTLKLAPIEFVVPK